MGDVLILGAGFSRAISEHMPLTDGLGNEVRDRISEQQPSRWLYERTFENGYFEAWLSGLAEDQPDLGDADNAERRSLFTRAVGLTQEILVECQTQAMSGSLPDWLDRLLWLAHIERSTLISFNYDTIVESAIDRTAIFGWPASARVQGYDVLDHLPPRAQPTHFAEPTHQSLSLLKLHGSTDWYWAPSDHVGATIRWAKDHRPPGLSPFLTPPTAAKSSFYDNPLTRELWQRAGSALRGALRIALIGYSLPRTDLTVSGMLQRHLDLDDVEIVVVNPDPDPVSKRLKDLGATRVIPVGGDDAVEAYVDVLEQECSQRLLRRFHSAPPIDPEAPFIMRISLTHGRIVDDIQEDDAGVLLRLAKHPSLMSLGGRADADRSRPLPGLTLRDLLARGTSAAGTLRAQLPDGDIVTIVGHNLDVAGDVVRAHILTPSCGLTALE